MLVAIATSVKIVLYSYAFKIRICNRLQNYNFLTNPTICILMDGYIFFRSSNKDLSETKTALRKENTTLFGRGVGRDEAVKSITDQLDCKCTEEDEFDNIKNQTEDEPFRVVNGLHDLVVVRHRRIEC